MNVDLLRKFVNQQFDEICLPSLKDFIRIPNLSPYYDPDWKTNGLLTQAAYLMKNFAIKFGIKGLSASILENTSPLLYVSISASSTSITENILMYGHFDKQPWFTGWDEGKGPTIPVVENGRLYGRGSADDGYALYACLLSIKSIQDQGLPHPRIIILIEGAEESGSPDMKEYLKYLKPIIKSPDLIICLDSIASDYNRVWLSTSTRGNITLDLSVQCLQKGVHSGKGTGIAPDSYMVLRNLISRIEYYDKDTKNISIPDMEVDITEEIRKKVEESSDFLKETLLKYVPLLDGVKMLNEDPVEVLINNTWKPSLAITGWEGIPTMDKAGNVLRPFTKLKLSFRIPPTLSANSAFSTLEKKLTDNPPFNSSVTISNVDATDGLSAPDLNENNKILLTKVSKLYFNNNYCEVGLGGSIPFMKILSNEYQNSQFLITGAAGYDCNAHGPNENLNLDYTKTFICSIAHFISEFKK